MRNRVLTLLFAMTAFLCSGQTFLTKYPKLTKKNLNEFFSDWKAYSDSIGSNTVVADSVIANIITWNNLTIALGGHPSGEPRYDVSPQEIEVVRYYLDVDTAMAKYSVSYPFSKKDWTDEQYVVDSVTPALPWRGLYLTSDIEEKLSTFAGGLRNGDKLEKINNKNVKELEKYIPVDYGHWGGYWWFTTFPIITNINYSDNLIEVVRRTSWCTGDVIWFVKENGRFIRQPEPVSTWIE